MNRPARRRTVGPTDPQNWNGAYLKMITVAIFRNQRRLQLDYTRQKWETPCFLSKLADIQENVAPSPVRSFCCRCIILMIILQPATTYLAYIHSYFHSFWFLIFIIFDISSAIVFVVATRYSEYNYYVVVLVLEYFNIYQLVDIRLHNKLYINT